ncbi:MAG: SAM-dependent methyltransferase [Gammaproteobacteria bacterium]|nr:MAG: SAM-dependent methyltransferase [Gammaproteobacteria bacterium]
MNNEKEKSKEKPMPWLAFQFMRLIMNIRKPFRNIEEEMNLSEIKKGFYILDFGCGLGFNTIPAAKAVGKEGRVFALDLNEQAIKIVEKKISKNSLDNVKIIKSSCDTGLEDKSIDLVYLHNTLPMIKEKQKVLKEITRVIKTGGKLSYTSRLGSSALSIL